MQPHNNPTGGLSKNKLRKKSTLRKSTHLQPTALQQHRRSRVTGDRVGRGSTLRHRWVGAARCASDSNPELPGLRLRKRISSIIAKSYLAGCCLRSRWSLCCVDPRTVSLLAVPHHQQSRIHTRVRTCALRAASSESHAQRAPQVPVRGLVLLLGSARFPEW